MQHGQGQSAHVARFPSGRSFLPGRSTERAVDEIRMLEAPLDHDDVGKADIPVSQALGMR